MAPSRVRRRNTRAISRAAVVSMMLESTGVKRLPVFTGSITQLNYNNKVQRWIRLSAILTTATPTAIVTPSVLAIADFQQYNVSAIRYNTVRPMRFRCWLESPAIASGTTFGVVVTDTYSLGRFTDRAVVGSTLAGVAYRYPQTVAQTIYATSVTTTLTSVACDVAIPAATNIFVTYDVFVEFE